MKSVTRISAALTLALALGLAGASALRGQDAATASSVVPRLIKFSGVISSQTSQETQNPTSDRASARVLTSTFSLYELQEGGAPLWSESQKVQLDDQGRYVVLLGATSSSGLPLDLFTSGKALWLGVQPQLSGVVEQPRVLLVAVPYALKASDSDTLGGKPASAYALAGSQTLLAPSTVPGSSASSSAAAQSSNPTTSGAQTAPQPATACSSITSDGTATANSIAMFTTNCNLESSAITQTSGNIGISGASPAGTKFQITDTPAANPGIHFTNHELLNTSATVNGTNKVLTFVMDASNMTISAGVTDSGYRVGVEGAGYANTAGFAGTLGAQYGVWGRAGISAAASGATVNNAYAGYFDIFNSVAGTTIANAYGVYILNNATTGTITNRYDLYAASANANNYFAGSVGIGAKTPAATLEVNGTAKFDNTVTVTGLTAGRCVQAGAGGLLTTVASACGSGGGGTITGVTAGTDLTGGGTSGTVTLNLDTTKVPQLVANNSFTGNIGVVDGTPGDTGLLIQTTDTSTANTAVSGLASGAGGTGVYGEAEGGALAAGVWGFSATGTAGLFSGDVTVTGNLSKAGGSFKIDDPIDPANKYLYHSFVESPDMKNIYDGVAVLDANGEVVVALPEWFGALNRDFRYQLTCIGGFAPVYIAEEVIQNHFKISGGKPGMKVSWMVTGIRQDAWADAHRIPVEVEKPAREQGYYIHPELFGQPPQKSIEWAEHPAQMQKVEQRGSSH